MAFSDYSTTPASNTTIAGINIAENCPAANVNNAIRQIMADGKALSVTVGGINTSSLMPKTGGEFSGQITRAGVGGYLYHANSTQNGGSVHFLPSGSVLPTPAEGSMVFFY